MINLRKQFVSGIWPGWLGSALALILLGGCTKDEATDYCKNHYRFHDSHLDSLATLNIELNEQGELSTRLGLPGGVIDGNSQIDQLLMNPVNVYTLQTTSPCREAVARVDHEADQLNASYTAECGAENKLEQVDVVLFENLPVLDEVLVNVITPATAKRFAISRQCERAIFRLDGKQGH